MRCGVHFFSVCRILKEAGQYRNISVHFVRTGSHLTARGQNDSIQDMYTFLIAFIPMCIVIYAVSHPRYAWKSFIPAVVFGGLAATVQCSIKKFFIFSTHVWTSDVASNFLYLFLTNILLGLAIASIPYLIFSRDKWTFKAASAMPLWASYYAVYIPFTVITSQDNCHIFMLIGLPMLYAGMSTLCAWFLEAGATAVSRKKTGPAVLFFLLTAANLFVPPVVHALWFQSAGRIFLIVSVCYAALAAFPTVLGLIPGKISQ